MRERNYTPEITDRIAETYLDMRNNGATVREASVWAHAIGRQLERVQDEEAILDRFLADLELLPMWVSAASDAPDGGSSS